MQHEIRTETLEVEYNKSSLKLINKISKFDQYLRVSKSSLEKMFIIINLCLYCPKVIKSSSGKGLS